MKKNYKYKKGLPGSPNEINVQGSISVDGYKSGSKDINNDFNIIKSNNITMKGVDFPVHGIDNLGYSQTMLPGLDYTFPGSEVFEVPLKGHQFGGDILKSLKEKIRDEIAPVGYNNALNRIIDVLNPFNKDKETDYEKLRARYDKYSPTHGDDNYDPDLFQGGVDVLNERQDLFSILLGLDQKHNTIPVSKYKPTKTKNNDDIDYYSSPLTEKQITDHLAGIDIAKRFGNLDEFKKFLNDPTGYDKWKIGYGEVTGNFHIDHGEDERGPYISYYDIWDLDPFGVGEFTNQNKILKTISDFGQEKILGVQPAELYNRLYYKLDDEGKIRFDDYPDAMSAYDRHQLEKKKQKGGPLQFPELPKYSIDNYEPTLTEEERNKIIEHLKGLQVLNEEKNNIGTYYLVEGGNGTVFYESKNPDVEDIAFTSPGEYNSHRENLGLPKDWSLIESRASENVLNQDNLKNSLKSIDSNEDLFDAEKVGEQLKEFEDAFKTDTTTRVDNVSVPVSVDSALKRAQIAVEEMARKGPHTDVPLYDHSYLQSIDKEKINRKLEENIIRNNIKELENKRDNERQEMHKAYYGKYELKNYDIDTMNEVLDIQEMLVDAGYDIGTYKYGERAGEIMLDGFWGPRTEKAYAKYLDDNFKKIVSEKNNIIKGNYDFSSLLNRGACDEKGCAAGMFNLYADIVGWDAVRNSGMIGDAWTLKKSMEDNGAYIKYNIFDGMKKPTIENHHESIMNAVNSNPLDYTSLQQGDVVGIYYSRSGFNNQALQEGKGTWNSHVGLISGYDDDGMPLITHNLSGNLEHDRADEIEDLLGRDMHITWVADPISGTGFKYKQIDKDSKEWKDYSDENKEYIDFMERKIYDHALKEELTDDDYFTNEERLKLNSNINHVKNNVSKIVDELGIPIDENKLTEVVLGLGNVETRLGLKNPTQEDIDDTLWQKKRMNNYINSPVIPTIFGPTETDLNDDGDTDDPGEKVNPYNVDPEEVSLGLGKMKINHLDEFTKNYFDIDRNNIQSDDKSLNLMIAKTAKAKYFLDQYSKRNKALNLSEHDRWMMAALMHNQGDEILLNFGTNEKYSLDEQVSRLRDLYEGRVSDMSATDFGHLSKLTVGDSKWKQMNKDAYERRQLAKYVKKTPRIYDALPKNLKRKVNRVSQGGWLKDGMNIINVGTFNLDDLQDYFVNSDEFEYAKGHESYISKLNRYITRSEQEYPYEQVYDTKRGKLTRQEILELALIESGNFQALVNGLSPAMEDYIIGTYYSGTDSAMTRDVLRQKGGSVPTEAEAKKNPRYNKDMDDDGIPVGLDIDDSVKVPKNIMLLQAMKESSLDPKKVSKKGAQGLTQVMPATLKDYISATGDKDVDVFNWKDSMKIQDWYMNNLYNRPWINKQNQTEQVRLAKTLAAYNWGPTKFNEYLNKKKSQGVNIYDNDMSWINDLPKETKEYVNTILFRNNEKFEGWVTDFNKNQDKELFINAYSEEYKKGGSLIFPEWKRIKKHWKRYLSGKSINRDMYNKLVAYGFIKKKKYKKKKKRSRSLKNIPSNYILNSIKLGKMKKGGNLSHQVKIYEDYVKGIFDGTSLENKAKSVVDKINRFYYYDLKGKDTHTLDHIKKLQKGERGNPIKTYPYRK